MPPRSNNTIGLEILLLTVRAFVGSFIPGLLQSHICFDIAASGFLSNQTCNVARLFDLDLEYVRLHMRNKEDVTHLLRTVVRDITSEVKYKGVGFLSRRWIKGG